LRMEAGPCSPRLPWQLPLIAAEEMDAYRITSLRRPALRR
jgi:hypothetical protein